MGNTSGGMNKPCCKALKMAGVLSEHSGIPGCSGHPETSYLHPEALTERNTCLPDGSSSPRKRSGADRGRHNDGQHNEGTKRARHLYNGRGVGERRWAWVREGDLVVQHESLAGVQGAAQEVVRASRNHSRIPPADTERGRFRLRGGNSYYCNDSDIAVEDKPLAACVFTSRDKQVSPLISVLYLHTSSPRGKH